METVENRQEQAKDFFPTEFCALTGQIVDSLIEGNCFSTEELKRWKEFRDFSVKFGARMDPFRNIECMFVERELDLNQDDILLDIGTGESIFPRYLLRDFQVPLTICDYDSYGFETQRKFFKDCGLQKVRLLESDATDTGIDDLSFTKISAISSIEHFLDNKDSECIREAFRLLRPGGRLVVTVPYSHCYKEETNVPYYHGGFVRRYDKESLSERFFSVAPFNIKTVIFVSPQRNRFVEETIKEYGDIGVFFWKWYESGDYIKRNLDSIWLTLLCMRLEPEPSETTFACCFTLEKPSQ